jgi:hypothetical protein
MIREHMQTTADKPRERARAWTLFAVLFVPLALLPLLPPIVQPAGYHTFADSRALFGVPSFLNVLSNAAFLVVGIAGIVLSLRRRVEGAALSWLTFFAGVALIAAGSSWYHLRPDDDTLVWDRLPMTVAFTALFVALVVEHVEAKLERTLLPIAIVVGVASVIWWRVTGDLKLYGWVQIAPFVAIATLLATYPARYTGRGWLAVGLICYALAKATEFADAAIYEATAHALSGHTVKHFLGALAPLCVYRMLATRRRAG